MMTMMMWLSCEELQYVVFFVPIAGRVKRKQRTVIKLEVLRRRLKQTQI